MKGGVVGGVDGYAAAEARRAIAGGWVHDFDPACPGVPLIEEVRGARAACAARSASSRGRR